MNPPQPNSHSPFVLPSMLKTVTFCPIHLGDYSPENNICLNNVGMRRANMMSDYIVKKLNAGTVKVFSVAQPYMLAYAHILLHTILQRTVNCLPCVPIPTKEMYGVADMGPKGETVCDIQIRKLLPQGMAIHAIFPEHIVFVGGEVHCQRLAQKLAAMLGSPGRNQPAFGDYFTKWAAINFESTHNSFGFLSWESGFEEC